MSADTPARILEVAEELFASNGYRAVSLRSIMRESGVNIAAVHYHFGSKEALLERIFELHCGPMNDERLRLLADCRAGPGRPPMLEQVLEAYLRPALRPADERARRFMRLRAAIAHEQADLSQQLVARHFNAVTKKFVTALVAELGHLPSDDFYWRMHFLLGAQYYTLANPGRIQVISGNVCDPSDAERAIRELVVFAAAGFRAAVATPQDTQSNKPSRD
jgi:AcrR family transcriptional regulator